MNDYMTLLHKHKINGGFLAPDRIPMEERNKNEMILELQNEAHTKDKEIERLNNILNELEKYLIKIKETSTPQERIMAKFVLEYIKILKGEELEVRPYDELDEILELERDNLELKGEKE